MIPKGTTINLMSHDIDTMLFCAFRYALGRKSYVVEDVKDLLIKYKEYLHHNTTRQIKAEIEHAIENDEAGMDCDVVCWKRVLEELV